MMDVKKKSKELSRGQLRTAEFIAGRILSAQKRMAEWLNRLTRGISPLGWLILLGCFCTAFGGYCLSLLLEIGK